MWSVDGTNSRSLVIYRFLFSLIVKRNYELLLRLFLDDRRNCSVIDEWRGSIFYDRRRSRLNRIPVLIDQIVIKLFAVFPQVKLRGIKLLITTHKFWLIDITFMAFLRFRPILSLITFFINLCCFIWTYIFTTSHQSFLW